MTREREKREEGWRSEVVSQSSRPRVCGKAETSGLLMEKEKIRARPDMLI